MQEAEAAGWSWEVELVPSPDRILRESEDLVATADSGILDRGVRWINLARAVVEAEVEGAWIVDLSGPTVEWCNITEALDGSVRDPTLGPNNQIVF